MGEIAQIPDGVVSCLGQRLVLLRANKKISDPKYLLYQFLGGELKRQISWNEGTGSTVSNLRIPVIKSLALNLPSLAEQIQIGSLLSSLDDRIALLRETNATLEAIAQALFKSWFVDFDPVRAKAEGRSPEGMDEATAALFPDGFEMLKQGETPSGWAYLPIGNQVEGIYDGPHATPPEAQDGPVFLGIKNLTGTGLDFSEIRHISDTDWVHWTRRVMPQSGDIVFSYEATLGFFALIPPDLKCCLGRRLALVRPHYKIGDGLFWFHQFISEPFQALLCRNTIFGATVNRIALKAFPDYPVLTPPEALRGTFSQKVAPLWAKIHTNQKKAQTLTELRDTLLPRLISGQLRLPQAEALATEAGL